MGSTNRPVWPGFSQIDQTVNKILIIRFNDALIQKRRLPVAFTVHSAKMQLPVWQVDFFRKQFWLPVYGIWNRHSRDSLLDCGGLDLTITGLYHRQKSTSPEQGAGQHRVTTSQYIRILQYVRPKRGYHA